MALIALTNQDEIQDAFDTLSDQIKAGKKCIDRKLNFIGGDEGSDVYWHKAGVWGRIGWYENRHSLVCGLENPVTNDGILQIACAFNPPFHGFDRSCSAVFAKDTETDIIYLAHKGSFTRVAQATTKGRWANWQTILWPDDKKSEWAIVCEVGSAETISELAGFVNAVSGLKSQQTVPESTARTKPSTLPRPPQKGWVYLLQLAHYYKIGVSINISQRVKQLTRHLPDSPTIVYRIKSDDSYGLEAKLHGEFASKRKNGEWFLLTDEDVQAIIERFPK